MDTPLTIARDDTGSCVSWTLANGGVQVRCPVCMTRVEIQDPPSTAGAALAFRCTARMCGHEAVLVLQGWPIPDQVPARSTEAVPTAFDGKP